MVKETLLLQSHPGLAVGYHLINLYLDEKYELIKCQIICKTLSSGFWHKESLLIGFCFELVSFCCFTEFVIKLIFTLKVHFYK